MYMKDLSSYERNKRAIRGLFEKHGYVLAIKALDIAEKVHCNKRKDGMAEFSHQIYICSYMVQSITSHLYHPDDALASAILHDLPEDYPEIYSLDMVKRDFGGLVYEIVKPLTKWDGFKKTPADYERYFSGIFMNRYSVLVKGVDRIHNFQTMMDVFTIERMKSYIKEVDDYFLPMLKAARKEYPQYLEAYLAVQHTLQRQSVFLCEIISLREEIIRLESK